MMIPRPAPLELHKDSPKFWLSSSSPNDGSSFPRKDITLIPQTRSFVKRIIIKTLIARAIGLKSRKLNILAGKKTACS